MTPKKIASDIRNVNDWLMVAGVAQFIQPYREVNARGSLRICAEGTLAASGVLKAHPFGSIAEYRGFVSSEAFSALLFDGSLLYLSYDFQGSELIGHRLLYYPCPITIEPEMSNEPILDILDYCLGETHLLRLRSPLRFDYDPLRAKANHPASHMHFQHEDCRLAVFAPMSVGRFLEFVFRNFYPDIWDKHHFLQSFRRPSVHHSMQRGEQHDFHLKFAISDKLIKGEPI